MIVLTAKENCSICSASHQRSNVAYGVTRDVQDVEASISEVVVSLILPDKEAVREWNFDHFPSLESGLWKWRVFFRGVSGQKGFFETWTNKQLDVFRKSSSVTRMIAVVLLASQSLRRSSRACCSPYIQMPVRENDRGDVLEAHTALGQNFMHVFLYS